MFPSYRNQSVDLQSKYGTTLVVKGLKDCDKICDNTCDICDKMYE